MRRTDGESPRDGAGCPAATACGPSCAVRCSCSAGEKLVDAGQRRLSATGLVIASATLESSHARPQARPEVRSIDKDSPFGDDVREKGRFVLRIIQANN